MAIMGFHTFFLKRKFVQIEAYLFIEHCTKLYTRRQHKVIRCWFHNEKGWFLGGFFYLTEKDVFCVDETNKRILPL